MSTNGHYDEISKIDKLRQEQLSRLRRRFDKSGTEDRPEPPVKPDFHQSHHRKLPQRKAWTN